MSALVCEPIVMTVQAGVMARSPAEFPYRIGVIGRDESHARELFAQALDRWGRTAALMAEDARTEQMQA